MPQRFLIPDAALKPGQTTTVDAERAHYLLRVLRCRVGDVIACFDGRGTAFDCTITGLGKRQAELQVTQVTTSAEPSNPFCHVVLALLKGNAMDRAIAQCVELGAHSIQLFRAARSNVDPTGSRLENKLSHWGKIIAGACEQSGRLYLPELHFRPVGLDILLDQFAHTQRIVLDQSGSGLRAADVTGDAVTLFVGPEGGWSDAERDLFARRGHPVRSLAQHTLRAETVPGIALGITQYLITASKPQHSLG